MSIHPLADVQSENIGEGTSVWQFSIVLKDASIGRDCNINCHCFIENDVVLGDRVTIKSGVYLWDGITIADDVFVGPNVTFANDKLPRSKSYPKAFLRTKIEQGASIGAGAIVLGGLTVGAYAMIGAGALVTTSVPAHALMVGSPARQIGWVSKSGEKLTKHQNGWISALGEYFEFNDNVG